VGPDRLCWRVAIATVATLAAATSCSDDTGGSPPSTSDAPERSTTTSPTAIAEQYVEAVAADLTPEFGELRGECAALSIVFAFGADRLHKASVTPEQLASRTNQFGILDPDVAATPEEVQAIMRGLAACESGDDWWMLFAAGDISPEQQECLRTAAQGDWALVLAAIFSAELPGGEALEASGQEGFNRIAGRCGIEAMD
jgi:hypothetical protein